MSRMVLLAVWVLIEGATAQAQTSLRIATYNLGLGRDGPGVLVKDILDQDEDIDALVAIITQISPDIILLTGFDVDYRDVAITAFQQLLYEAGLDLPYHFAPIGNAGVRSGLDLNGNGRLGDWADSWGFGRFEGHKSMALLSRLVIDENQARSFTHYLWKDLPGAVRPGGAEFLTNEAWAAMRLSSRGHYDVPVVLPTGGRLHLLLSYPTPPVFDGAEDLNGLRNDAEIRFWVAYLNGARLQDSTGGSAPFTKENFVILADLNADPNGGDGIGRGLAALLAHPSIVDPLALQNTVDWPDIGTLRVDYVLPSSGIEVLDSGVYWPEEPDGAELLALAGSAHRLVWVDVEIQ